MKRTTLPVSRLVRQYQSRTKRSHASLAALKASIQQYGILSELHVTPHAEQKGMHAIISGNSRFDIAKDLGIEEVPVAIFPEGLTRAEYLRFALTLDTVRENLSLWDIADAIGELASVEGITQAQAAASIHAIGASVASKITASNARLSDEAKVLVDQHKIGLSIAYMVATKAKDHAQQLAVLKQYVEKKLTRDDVVKLLKGDKPEKKIRFTYAINGVSLVIACKPDSSYESMRETLASLAKELVKQERNNTPIDTLPRFFS